MKKLLFALSLCLVVAGLCGTTLAQGRPIYTSTSISACKQLVDPGQPVCFTTQTFAFFIPWYPTPVYEGEVCFFDEFSGPLGCVDVNRYGQAQFCEQIFADVDVFAKYYPYANGGGGVPGGYLLPSHSTEVAVFLTTDPGSPKYFPGTHPGCLIPHIAPAGPPAP